MATEKPRRRAAAGRGPIDQIPDCRLICGPAGGPIQQQSRQIKTPPEQTKTPCFQGRGEFQAGCLWAMRDLNPRHSRCKRDALAN